MKRPLAVIGTCCLSALAVALLFGKDSFLSLCLLFLAGGLLCMGIRKYRHYTLVFLTGLGAVALLWGYTEAYLTPSLSLKGETAEIEGTLCELPYQYYDRYYYKLKTGQQTVLVSSRYKLKIEPFDTLKATVRFYGETDASQDLYNFSKGIAIRASIDPLKSKTVVKNDHKPLYYHALMIRQWITGQIHALLPEREAGFVNAIITGDKYQLPENEKQMLRAAGISYIVVVSGFHLAVITRLMLGFFRLITRKKKRLSSALCIAFVFFYMAVTGFPLPVVRAGIMQIFLLIGDIVLRESDSFNMLGLSALVICLVNPYAVADVSFIMSFSSTFGILLLSRTIAVWTMERIAADKLQILIKALVNVFAISVSAYLFILPVTILYFKQAAIYSVITSLFVDFAVMGLIYLAIFMIITGFLPLAWCVWFLADYILNVAEAVAGLPFPLIATSQEFVPFWLMAAVIGGLTLLFLKVRGRAVRYYALITVLSFIVFSVGDSFLKSGSIKVSVLDVGNGISCVVNCCDRTYLLSCGGSYYKAHALDDYLTDSCVYQITYMLLLDDKNACTAYAKQILEHYDMESLQVFDKEDYTENIKLLLRPYELVPPDSTVYIDTVRIQTRKEKNCMAVYANFNGLKLLLIEGKTDCRKLPESWRECDILIVNGDIEHTELLCAGNAVISDEYERLERYDAMANGSYGQLHATAGQGNWSCRVYQRGQTEIRRENGWLN